MLVIISGRECLVIDVVCIRGAICVKESGRGWRCLGGAEAVFDPFVIGQGGDRCAIGNELDAKGVISTGEAKGITGEVIRDELCRIG